MKSLENNLQLEIIASLVGGPMTYEQLLEQCIRRYEDKGTMHTLGRMIDAMLKDGIILGNNDGYYLDTQRTDYTKNVQLAALVKFRNAFQAEMSMVAEQINMVYIQDRIRLEVYTSLTQCVKLWDIDLKWNSNRRRMEMLGTRVAYAGLQNVVLSILSK